MRCPSTSDLVDFQSNKAYDKLAVISENIEDLQEISEFIMSLKDWLRANINTYISDYESTLTTTITNLNNNINTLASSFVSYKNGVDGSIEAQNTLINQIKSDLLILTNSLPQIDTSVTEGSTKLPTSGSVYTFVNTAISSIGGLASDLTTISAKLVTVEAEIDRLREDLGVSVENVTVLTGYYSNTSILDMNSVGTLSIIPEVGTLVIGKDIYPNITITTDENSLGRITATLTGNNDSELQYICISSSEVTLTVASEDTSGIIPGFTTSSNAIKGSFIRVGV
jgi:hypothetical protein